MKRFLAASVGLAMASMPMESNAAPILEVASGILMGAKNINVAGAPYDVRFAEGSCGTVFWPCVTESFTFQSEAMAVAAAEAPLSQVFDASVIYDTDPGAIFGCVPPALRASECYVLTPFMVITPRVSSEVHVAIIRNLWHSVPDYVYVAHISPGYNTDSDRFVYAVWTPSDVSAIAIPEPSPIGLFGLRALALVRRRRFRQ